MDEHLVERVAIALFRNDPKYAGLGHYWTAVSDKMREMFRSDARAAIQAVEDYHADQG